MPAIGMALLWGGYTLGFWGFTLIKGYEITLGEIVIPGRFKGKWPPDIIQSGYIGVQGYLPGQDEGTVGTTPQSSNLST